MTAERLAYQSELNSKGYLSDIEHGLALPSLETLRKLADVLEVDLLDLLTDPKKNQRHELLERTRGLAAAELRRLIAATESTVSNTATSPQPASEREHPNSTLLPAFAEVEVAAGKRGRPRADAGGERQKVRLPGKTDPVECFAVRASGQSMEGWRREIRCGDWLIFRWSRVGLAAAAGRVALVAYRDRDGDLSLQVKRILRRHDQIVLASDSPRHGSEPVTSRHELLGLLVASHAPASLAPKPDEPIPEALLGPSFGLTEHPGPGWTRVEGHLFALLGSEEVMPSSSPTSRRRHCLLHSPLALLPAETAYVLTAEPDGYRYRGVAETEGANTLTLML